MSELQKFRITEIRIIEVFVRRFSMGLKILFELTKVRSTHEFDLDRVEKAALSTVERCQRAFYFVMVLTGSF